VHYHPKKEELEMRTMSKLGLALRRKFKTPREALQALGLPESLLDIKGLAFDQALPGTSAKVKLEEILCQILSGAELQHARDLLHGIDADDGEATNGELEQEEAEDDEDVDEEEGEEERREHRKRTMAKVADWLAREKHLNDEEIFDAMKDFPAPGLEHIGGRLAEDLEQVMESWKDRRRRMARDAKKRALAADRAEASLLQHFPEAARLFAGSGLEAGIGGAEAEQRLAMDAAAADGDSFAEMFADAARIRIC
jgi:hypothetical protein